MGRDTAYLFAEEGAKVVVTGRNEQRAKAAVDKIREAGGEATYVLADTSDLSSAQKIFDAAIDAYALSTSWSTMQDSFPARSSWISRLTSGQP